MRNNESFNFDDAVFTYFVSSQVNPMFKKQVEFAKRRLVINHTEGTSVLISSNSHESVCVIGLCVDSHAEIKRNKIPDYLLHNENLGNLFMKTRRLAGRFVILYETKGEVIVFNDPAGLLSVFYNLGKDVCLSSCDELIRKHFDYEYCDEHLDIRNGSLLLSLQMPNDITVSKNVKALLPNHYIDIDKLNPVRFFPVNGWNPKLKFGEKQQGFKKMFEKHITLIDNIVSEYAKYYDIAAPITSGYDSRVVLSFLRRKIKNIPCYTFKHDSFNAETPDFYIPPKICEVLKLSHAIIPDADVSDAFFKEIQAVIGEYHMKYTVDLGQTFISKFKGKALVTGCISEHIGKLYWGDSGPLYLANLDFFKSMHNNTSKHLHNHVKPHFDELNGKFTYKYIHDLFALEIMGARWSAQALMIYGVMGVSALNIYNCREIIEDWMCVPRKLRKNKKFIHYSFLERLAPELLTFPFNPTTDKKEQTKSRIYENPLLLCLYRHYAWIRRSMRKGEQTR